MVVPLPAVTSTMDLLVLARREPQLVARPADVRVRRRDLHRRARRPHRHEIRIARNIRFVERRCGGEVHRERNHVAVRGLERQPKQIRVVVLDDTDQAQGVGLVGGRR